MKLPVTIDKELSAIYDNEGNLVLCHVIDHSLIHKDLEYIVKIINNFPKAIELLRNLFELQNGTPLVRYEEEYNKTMTDVINFLNNIEDGTTE